MKKLISVLLSVLMLMTFAVPGISAFATDKEVTVYIEGYGHGIYSDTKNPSAENQIFPTESILEPLMGIFNDLTKDLVNGLVTGDYTEYCDRIYNAIAPTYADVKLDKNGEATDGSGCGKDMLTDSYYMENYVNANNIKILFEYDWRLSVEHNAEILEKFIDRVCREQNVSKVNLLGRCLGGNVVSAYLQNGKNLHRINDVVMLIASTEGVDFIGALFSGKIKLDAEAVDNWANYFLSQEGIITDPAMNDFVTSLVSFINQIKVLGFGLDFVQMVLDEVKENVLARTVRDTYGSFPSYWAMVPDEYYDNAIDFIFNTDELKAEYAGLIEKADSYHDNIQITARDRMTELKAQGKDFLVISKYNYPNFPLSKDADAQSDGTALTSATSFGAVCAPYEKVLSGKYINLLTENEKKYLSPDNMIDASKCLFPDTTWFIKNCYHNNFPHSMDKLIVRFFATENMTVFTDTVTYPQFVDYSKETGEITPVEGPDDLPTETEKTLVVFIRFFTNFINFIKKLLNGELGSLFG